MAIVVENANSGSSGFATSHTLSINSGTNADRAVIVQEVCQYPGASITGATYAGNAMTAAYAQNTDGAFEHRSFYLAGAGISTGANNTVVSLSTADSTLGIMGIALSGVDTGSLLRDTDTGFGTNGAPSVTVDSEVGDVVVMLLGVENTGSSVTAGSGATLQRDVLAGDIGWRMAVLTKDGASTSTTIAASYTNGVPYSFTVFTVKAAAGGGGGGSSTGRALLLGVG